MKKIVSKSEVERLLEILDPLRHEDVALRFCRIDDEGSCELIDLPDYFTIELNGMHDDFLDEMRADFGITKQG